MKKISGAIKLIVCWSLCLLFVFCASKGPGKLSLDPTSQKFLDNISYIILPVEEKIFREMPSEDRGEFIQDFWARRDPDLSTPVNEFRQAYYARLATADKTFRAGMPGRKTDRGRIYILLGPPTNIIRKAMGDVPYEAGKYVQASTLETGTLTERPTEIWVYDQYPEYFSGPLRLVFVDYNSTGNYKLTTNIEITPFSMVSPTWDEPDLAKYHLLGEIERDERSLGELGIFDYDVSADVIRIKDSSSASIFIKIPYARLDYRQEGENYSCDLLISAEARDSQKRVLSRKEEPFSLTFSGERLKEMIANKMSFDKVWELDLPLGSEFIYFSLTDNVRGKRLRKLLRTKGS
jgi:GWxTD domain-containing protein